MAKKKTPVMLASSQGDQFWNGIKARQVAYEEITNVPLATYLVKAGRFLNTVPAVYYDTAVFVGGTAITPQHTKTLFVKGLRDQDSVVASGTAYTKTKVHTNMSGDGQFEGGVTFILEEINVELLILSDKLTTIALGEISDPTLTALANYSASAHYYAMTRQFELAFLRNEQEMITGRLHEFPSLFLASGAFGNDEGFIQNGFGRVGWNKLPRARVLESLDKFSFELRPLAGSFTPQVAMHVAVNMVGKAIKPLFE